MEGNNEEEGNFIEDFGENYEDDDFQEDQLDLEGDDISGSNPPPLGGIYNLFHTVLNKEPKDSTKVSNLNKDELGDLGISVREAMRIALLSETFGHQVFANFFLAQAGIINTSSMSKEGWFTELFVTSKKFATRESSSNVNTLPQFKKGKWKMFSKNKNQVQDM